MDTPTPTTVTTGDLVPIATLTPYPGNARRGDVTLIAASLTELGQYRPLVVQRSTGFVLAGNHTLAAATSLGWSEVAVTWVDVDDTTARRIVLADNRTSDLAGYDDEALLALLSDLDGGDWVGTGFTAEDLAALEETIAGPTARAALTDPDDVPDVPADPRTKLGDVWLLGPHRLVCGDCTDITAVTAVMAGSRADLILTDPPYCSGGYQESGRSAGSIGTKQVDADGVARLMPSIANDTLSTRGYQALMRAMLHVAPADLLYVFTDWRQWTTLFDVAESTGFGVRSMIVWDKGTAGMGRIWRSQHELVLWGVRAKINADAHVAAGNVLTVPRSGNPLHPTQKPVEVITRLLGVLDGADVTTVFDPFAGSGSTLIACHTTGRLARLARLIEIDPVYCDVICRRWQEHTGTVPVLESTGRAVNFTDPPERP